MKKAFLIIGLFGFFVAASAQEKTEDVQKSKTLNSLNVEKQRVVMPNKAAQLKAIPVSKVSKSTISKLNSEAKSDRIDAINNEKKQPQVIEQKATSTK